MTKLWRTIKGIDGRAKREAENEAITFNGISFSSSKQLATKFNQQFNTSKLGRHTSSRETRVVTRETKRKPLEMVRTFTTDLVMKATKSCRNSKAFGPDKLSIFHLKHLGPRAIEYITTLFNLSATTCQIPAIWKSSLIIPIPKLGKDTSQGTSYRPISLICFYQQSTNISSLLKTNTGSDVNTLPPRLCCSYQQTLQLDSTRGSPRSNILHCCRVIGGV